MATLDSFSNLRERRTVLPVNGHDRMRSDEDVQLRASRRVGHRSVHDEVREIIELLDLGALAEVLCVLYGERVKAERPIEHGSRFVVHPVKVKPEEGLSTG